MSITKPFGARRNFKMTHKQNKYGGLTLPKTNADDWPLLIEMLSNYMKRSCRHMMQKSSGKNIVTYLPMSLIGSVEYQRMSAQQPLT